MSAQEKTKAPNITVRVLGSGRDVGRSCILVTLGHRHVLFDCGVHPGLANPRDRFPDVASLPALDAVVVTHFHLDHAGALPLLHSQTSFNPANTPTVMTAPTKELCRLMLSDFVSTSAARKQYCPFGERDIAAMLQNVTTVELAQPFRPENADDIEIVASYAGHVLGAVMYSVTVDGVGACIFSGDFSMGAGKVLRGADIPVPEHRPDVFITEATYCGTVRRSGRNDAEAQFCQAILSTIAARGKVLVPVSALGHAHELVAALRSLWNRAELGHVPVYAVTGLLARASAVYQQFAGTWCSTFVEQEKPRAGEHDQHHHKRTLVLKEFSKARDWNAVTGDGPMVVFATPGNLSTGLSFDLFRQWCGDSRNTVIVPGYCFGNTLAASVLSRSKLGSGHHVGDVKCRLVNMSFSGHADAVGITRAIRRLQPRKVVLVHGDAAKIVQFQGRLQTALGRHVQVHAPANGESIVVPPREDKEESTGATTPAAPSLTHANAQRKPSEGASDAAPTAFDSRDAPAEADFWAMAREKYLRAVTSAQSAAE